MRESKERHLNDVSSPPSIDVDGEEDAGLPLPPDFGDLELDPVVFVLALLHASGALMNA